MTTASVAPRENLLVGDNRYKAILRLAMPTVVAMLSQSVVNEVDVVFFSRLPRHEGSNGQAALLPCLILVWLFGGSLSAISVGTQAYVARRFAEGRREVAGAVLANAAWFCLLAGTAFSILGLLLMPWLVRLMITVPAVQHIALRYTRWRMLGVVSMSMTMAIKAFFDGLGKTHVHLVAAIVMNVFNVLFCWMFIFGHGVPHMGPPGAGLAAFLATWIGLAIMIWYAWLVRGEYRPLRWSNLSRKMTWDILKLSIPAALATVTMMVGFGLFARISGRLDSEGAVEAVNGAATTDIVEILKLTFTACIAFGTATATLVGHSLGAKKPEEAQKYGWASVRLGLVIFGIIGLCEGVFFTPNIVGFISHSPAVQAAAVVPMRIMGLVTPLIAVAMILSEVLFGAGNTRFVAAAQFALVFLWLVPGAFVMGLLLHFGLVGVWTSACAYAVFAAIVMGLKFHGGSWKTIKL
jgi:MATE family, multidrug efflux pump